MSGPFVLAEDDDYSDDEWDPDEYECTWCGGDCYTECDDPIQCTRRHVAGLCPCGACNATGLRSHQTIF